MVSNVKLVKNTGKFYDFASKGAGLVWGKNTLLFAPNGYGKSTLVNIFRSLANNDPKIIRARRTLNALEPPGAVIIIDGVNRVFNGIKWDKPFAPIEIFDTSYIFSNILAQEIEHEHRKNIHRIIIGSAGVKLAEELASLKNREKDRRRRVDELSEQFQFAAFRLPLETFLYISPEQEADVSQRIQKLEQARDAKIAEVHVRSLRSPRVLSVSFFDLEGLKSLLGQTLTAVHKESEEQVLTHIQQNFKDKTGLRPIDWRENLRIRGG